MDRRAFVTATTGAALTVCLAGCLGGDDSSSSGDGNSTSDDSPGGIVDDSGNPGDNNTNSTVDDSDNSDTEQSEDARAEFTWQPVELAVQTPVDFDASDSTGDIVEYRWDFDGDGSIESATTAEITTHVFDETGERPVTLEIETNDGETATVTRQVSVGGVAAVFIINPPTPVTERTTTIDATGSAGDIVEYRWDFTGDGNFDELTGEPIIEYTFETAGARTITLEVEDADGQTDTVSLEVSVNETFDRLVATFDWQPEEPVVGEEVTFDATDSLGDIVEYRWDFDGDDTVDEVSSDATASHTFTDVSGEDVEIPVTLEVEGSEGETDVASNELRVDKERPPAPEADFDWVPSGVTEGEETTFQAFSVTGDIVEFRWDFDDDGTFEEVSGAITTTHTFTDIAGEVERPVTLEVEDSRGRTDAVTYEVPIEGKTGPEARFDVEPSNPDTGQETTLDASASTGDIVEYRWDFDGDDTIDETTDEPSTTHTFEQTGATTVVLEVEGSSGETDTSSLDIAVGQTVDPEFEWEPQEPAVGEEVTFDASASTGDIVEYRWDFDGDDTFEVTTDIPTATRVFETAGTATVTLEIKGEAGEPVQTTREVPVGE